jgi:hypothetical protein
VPPRAFYRASSCTSCHFSCYPSCCPFYRPSFPPSSLNGIQIDKFIASFSPNTQYKQRLVVSMLRDICTHPDYLPLNLPKNRSPPFVLREKFSQIFMYVEGRNGN